MQFGIKIFFLLLVTVLGTLSISNYITFATGKLALLSTAMLLGIIAITAYLFSRTITHPLQDLVQCANAIAEHDFRTSTELKLVKKITVSVLQQQDEIGQLARAFQQMETELEQSIEYLKQTTAAKERMESELQIGRDIQMNLLTLTVPSFPKRADLDLHAILQPAREVGGDFYDFYFFRKDTTYLYLLEDNFFCFCIGDASGKGVPAALFMAVTKTLLKSQANIDRSPAKILTHVNQVISVDNPSCMFMTLFFGVLNLTSGELVFTNAGHNPPYIRRHDGSLELLDQRHGPLLGIMDGLTYQESRTLLETGDFVIIYTDGVTEAMDGEHNLFSQERLEAVLQSEAFSSAEAIIDATVEAVRVFRGDAEPSDDLTMLSLQYRGQPAAQQGESTEFAIKEEVLSSLRKQWH